MTTKFVLQDMLATKRTGKNIYFSKWIPNFGPMGTSVIKEAKVFDTRQEALRSPAMLHALSYYEVKEYE